MAISVFPAPVTSTLTASSITCASPVTLYGAPVSLQPAIYTITCVNTTVAKVEFKNSLTNIIATATTISGTVTLNLSTAADRVVVWTNTGTDVVVTITQTAAALTNNLSGTLDTITATGTYTGTSTSGYAYVAIVG